jgi:methyl-accepting chemotaxis protein
MGLIVITMLACCALTGWVIYYYSWSAIADTPDLDLAKVAQIFDDVNWKLVKFVGLMTLFISFVSVFVSHKIAGPVFRFEEMTKIVANGNLTQEIHLRTGDELHDLEVDFNKMIVSLRDIVKKDREIITGLIQIGDKIQGEIEKKAIDRDALKQISREIHTITTELSGVTANFKISEQDLEA